MTDRNIPALTTEQMIEVDRLMVEDYGIALIQMMENAGVQLALLTRQLLHDRVVGRRIGILCGTGNNGGGGMVAARHLCNWGADVLVVLSKSPGALKDVAAAQWATLEKLPVEREVFDPENPPNLTNADAILDALIGYGLKGDPQGAAAQLIRLINEADWLTISLDAPSGLDMSRGVPGHPCVGADATLTLALPKIGLKSPEARSVVGDLYLADIGVPPVLYRQLGLDVPPLFDEGRLLRMDGHERPKPTATRSRLNEYELEDHYSVEVDDVMVAARHESRRMRSKYVGTGHILLGLLRDKENLAADVLGEVGVDLESARKLVKVKMGRYKKARGVLFRQPPLSKRSVHVMRLAVQEARRLAEPDVMPEHVLLALLEYQKGVANAVLEAYKLRPADLRSRLRPASGG